METVRCPYCESKVRLLDVEAEDGECPECGAPIVGSLLFAEQEDDDEDEDYLEEEEQEDLTFDDDDDEEYE